MRIQNRCSSGMLLSKPTCTRRDFLDVDVTVLRFSSGHCCVFCFRMFVFSPAIDIVAPLCSNQTTPLHKAAFNGHANVATAIIGAKADLEARTTTYIVFVRVACSCSFPFRAVLLLECVFVVIALPHSHCRFRSQPKDSSHSRRLERTL